MPMMAVYEQNDALNSARLLATTTLDELEGREAVDEVVMVNMYRLIDGYRAHGFYGLELDDDGSGDEFRGASMLQSGERRLREVRTALEQTVAQMGDKDKVLQQVEMVLRAAAYPEAATASPDDRSSAKSFLTILVTNLRRFSV